jgi:hypothetical protein
MAAERVERHPTWNDRVFGAIPLAPSVVATGLVLTLLFLFLATRSIHEAGASLGFSPSS